LITSYKKCNETHLKHHCSHRCSHRWSPWRLSRSSGCSSRLAFYGVSPKQRVRIFNPESPISSSLPLMRQLELSWKQSRDSLKLKKTQLENFGLRSLTKREVGAG